MTVRVRDLMTPDPVTIDETADVHELERLFVNERIHGVPVVDRRGKLAGVVSQSDLIAWHYELGIDGTTFYDGLDLAREDDAEGYDDSFGVSGEETGRPRDDDADVAPDRPVRLADIRSAEVREVMTPVVHAIGPDAPVGEAATRMRRHRLHRLVVVDSDLRPIGVISALDLLGLVPGVEAAPSSRRVG